MFNLKVDGLSEFLSDLRKIDLDRSLNKAQQKTQEKIVRDAQSNIRREGIPQASLAAQGITGRVMMDAAVIELEGHNPVVRAAVFGTAVHYVWGRPVPAASMRRRVFKPWVGSGWDIERDLYGLSEAVDTNDIAEDWLEAVFDEIRKKAFS